MKLQKINLNFDLGFENILKFSDILNYKKYPKNFILILEFPENFLFSWTFFWYLG